MAARGYRMVRYADDFVILRKSRAEAEAAMAEVRDCGDRITVTVHSIKTAGTVTSFN